MIELDTNYGFIVTMDFVNFGVVVVTIWSFFLGLITKGDEIKYHRFATKSPLQDRIRRFLYTFDPQTQTQTTPFCYPVFCTIHCPNGFLKASTGCLYCQCNTASSPNFNPYMPGGPIVMSPNVYLTNPCNPAMPHCNLNCPFGYVLGANGCQNCTCKASPNAMNTTTELTTVNVTLQTVTADPGKTSSSTLSSFLSLPTAPNVVYSTPTPVPRTTYATPQYMVTSSPSATFSSTSFSTHKVHTTPSKHSAFNDPCIPTQTTCNKDCNGDYLKGPGDCQYCICMSVVPSQFRPKSTTTINPKFTHHTTVPPYLDMSPTSEACIVAKMICNEKCPNGIISHPSDCLWCTCRNQQTGDLDDSNNTAPASIQTTQDTPVPSYVLLPKSSYVQLQNPCVNEHGACRLVCSRGYVTRLNDCQLCACR